jgi:hypothetical protein
MAITTDGPEAPLAAHMPAPSALSAPGVPPRFAVHLAGSLITDWRAPAKSVNQCHCASLETYLHHSFPLPVRM